MLSKTTSMKKFLFYLILVLLLIQLYRPTKNRSELVAKDSITASNEVPEKIQSILKNSCNDCHTNNTNYLWYHNIAPISWVVARHVKEGKEHLNFDEWTVYNKNQKRHILEDLKESIETREMPIVGYLKMHPEAIVSDSDNELLLDWIDSLETK